MKITSTYLENLSFTQENGSKDVVSGANNNFQSVMDKSIDNIADKPKPKTKAEPAKYAPVRNTADANVVKQPPVNAEPDAPAVKNENRAQDTPAPANEAAAKPAETDTEPLETINADIAVQIAAVLSVPLDIVIQILDDLGFEAVELTDKPKLNLFMQRAFDAGSPVELLNVPGIGETFTDIERILTQPAPDNPQGITVNAPVLHNSEAALTRPDIPVETTVYAPLPAALPVSVAVKPPAVESAAPVDIVEVTDTPVMENTVIKTAPAQTPEFNAQTRQDNAFAPAAEQEVIVQAEDGEAVIAAPQTPARTVTVSPQQTRAPDAPREIINQIADRIRVEVRGNVTELRLLLRPENLGEVSLKIATVNGVITAQFIAENQRVRQVIEANFAELRDALAERGIKVGELSVSVGDDAANEALESYLREAGRAERAGQKIGTYNAPEPTAILTEITDDIYGATVSYTA